MITLLVDFTPESWGLTIDTFEASEVWLSGRTFTHSTRFVVDLVSDAGNVEDDWDFVEFTAVGFTVVSAAFCTLHTQVLLFVVEGILGTSITLPVDFERSFFRTLFTSL